MANEVRITKADFSDIAQIERIYAEAREFMRASGNPDQWQDSYPPVELTRGDIESGYLYKVESEGDILGVFFFAAITDPTYAVIEGGEWKSAEPYAVIHRVAISSFARGKGVARAIFDYCYGKFPNLKIDTHRDNAPMQKALLKAGFEYCGIIRLLSGAERLAYQKT